jgi:hypothetical protein
VKGLRTLSDRLTPSSRYICHYEHPVARLHVFSGYSIPCGIRVPATWEIHKNYMFQNVAAAADFDVFDQWPESEIYR